MKDDGRGEGKAEDSSTIVQTEVGGGPPGVQETGLLPLLRGGVLARAQPGKLAEGCGGTGAGFKEGTQTSPALGQYLPVGIGPS